MVSHCGFDLYFPGMMSDVEHCFKCWLAIWMSSLEKTCLLPISSLDYLVLGIEFEKFFIDFGY